MLVKVKEVKVKDRVLVRRQEVELVPGMNCLLGPSGLGKTTFLRAILNEMKHEVSYLPQELSLPHYATPRDVALHVAKVNKCCTRHQYLIKFNQYVKILGVDRLVGERIRNMSAGEKERIAVAVTLARGCKLMLADEPGTHLDPSNLIKVMALIKHESEVSLVVLHNPLGFPFCDKFYTLKDGALVTSNPKEALGISYDTADDCIRLCFS